MAYVKVSHSWVFNHLYHKARKEIFRCLATISACFDLHPAQ